jgi:hypothetical protein
MQRLFIRKRDVDVTERQVMSADWPSLSQSEAEIASGQ